MSLARMLPNLVLVGVMVLVVAPVAFALRMMNSPTQDPSTSKKSAAGKVTTLAGFDGERAYQYLLDQCKIGTRISGTEGNRTLRKQMADHFSGRGAHVTLQPFTMPHPIAGGPQILLRPGAPQDPLLRTFGDLCAAKFVAAHRCVTNERSIFRDFQQFRKAIDSRSTTAPFPQHIQ